MKMPKENITTTINMEPIPDFLKSTQIAPLSPELQAKLDADLAKAKEASRPPAVDEALRKAQTDAKTAKARARIAKMKAKQSGATSKMPASGKDAAAIIAAQQKGKHVKPPGPKEQQLRTLKTSPAAAAAKPQSAKPAAPKAQEKTPMKTSAKKAPVRKARGKAKAASTARRKSTATRAAPKSAAKPTATRAGKAAPSGMVVEILKLASRPNGATPAELNELTKWKGAPWKWLFANPKKTGYCDRWGYTFEALKDDNGTHYKVTKKAA